MLAEGEQTPADGVARGLVARLDQELAVGEELLLGERHTVDLAANELADQIVLGVASALLDQTLEVSVQLAARAPEGLTGPLAGASELGIVVADHLVGRAVQQLPVVTRHAEAPGDHGERERCRDALDEVALAGCAPGRCRVEDLDRDALEILASSAHGIRREVPARNAAHRHVSRRIEQNNHLRHLDHRCIGAAERDPLRAREAQWLRRDLHDVGVLRDRPERFVPGRFDARDRCLGPQPRPRLVRVAVACAAVGIDEVERVDAGRHRVGAVSLLCLRHVIAHLSRLRS